MRDPSIEEVKSRIRVLLARTPARGCTEAEAQAAMEKALQLMALHGLTANSVLMSRAALKVTRRRSTVDTLWPTIAWVSRCRCFFKVTNESRQIVYLGCDPWPEVASYLHAVAAGATARAARDFARSPEARRRRSARTKSEARRAFVAGFVDALKRKIRGLVNSEDPEHHAGLARATSALASEGPMKPVRHRQVRIGARYGDAAAAGVASGEATQVGFGLRGKGGPLALTDGRSNRDG